MSNVYYNANVHLAKDQSKSTKAYATLFVKVSDDCSIAINGFRIVQSKAGKLFVAPPQTKGTAKDGQDTWFDDVRFLETKPDEAFRGPEADKAFNAILEAYGQKVGSDSRAGAAAANSNQPAPDNQRPTSPVSNVAGW